MTKTHDSLISGLQAAARGESHAHLFTGTEGGHDEVHRFPMDIVITPVGEAPVDSYYSDTTTDLYHAYDVRYEGTMTPAEAAEQLDRMIVDQVVIEQELASLGTGQ